MNVSLKCQYAIRGILELARRHGQGPVPVSEIAKTYSISTRFLEVILNDLKKGRFVAAKRGIQGGFYLAVRAEDLTLGDIIRFIDGPLEPVKCVVGREGRQCPRLEGCPLSSVWDRARRAVEAVYDSANFADLARGTSMKAAPDYAV